MCAISLQRLMIACVDVDYRNENAVAACVIFRQWTDAEPTNEYAVQVTQIAPYQPGQFYVRELPCLLTVLEQVTEPLSMIVVDGSVWLDDSHRAGLGAKLYEAEESLKMSRGILIPHDIVYS